jgi:hypothetical protein
MDEIEDDEGYTGWDLPEHPELRAWIETLPPLSEEAMYRVVLWSSEGDKFTYHLLMPMSDEQAFEEFDFMYLSAHNGVYGSDIVDMSLWTPEQEFRRRKLANYQIAN